MISRDCIDKLPGDPYPLAALAHASFKYVADAKIAPNLLYVSSLALVNEG